MQGTIFWHDYETTGTDPALDRPVQFAGFRTDLDLNPVGEPVNLLCRPADDTVPQLEAFLVTGILPSRLVQQGLNERDFAEAVHQQLAEPGTIGAGYNSLRFDDEFSRHLFYRNLIDPYAREWQNRNSRWDIIDLCRMACALRPEGIEWPEVDGVPSFRLEALTAANGIDHGDAHDALADVHATINVARLLKHKVPRLYQYLLDLRAKQRVIDQLYPLGKQPVVHVSSMYPAAEYCLAVVLPLCQHPTNSNGIICFDLSKDPTDLIQLNPVDIRQRLFTPAADLPEDMSRIPLKVIHINRCPAVAPMATLKTADAGRLKLDLDAVQQHQQQLQRASGVVEKLQDVYAEVDYQTSDDPDLQLYGGGFFSGSDREAMESLRHAGPAELKQAEPGFQDPRLPEMLFRYRARNYPSSLSAEEQSLWQRFCQERWHARAADVEKQLAEINRLRQTSAAPVDLLREMEGWLTQHRLA